MKKQHGFGKVHLCKLCEKCFETNLELTTHLKTFHKKKTYVCEKCGKAFPSWAGKSNHKTFMRCQPEESVGTTEEKLKSHKCDMCSKTFTRKSSLDRHVKTIHEIGPTGQNEKNFECGTCGKEFESETELENHIENVHNKILNSEKSENCENNDNRELETINENEEKFDVKKESVKNHQCNLCGKEFNRKFLLKKHIERVHEPKDISKAKVKTKSKENQKKYTCDKCDKSFNKESTLGRHIKSVHKIETKVVSKSPKIQENNESKSEATETEMNDENIDENTTDIAAEENSQYWKTMCQTLYNECKTVANMHNEKLNLLKAEKEKNAQLELENANLRAEIAELKSEKQN